MTRIVQDPGQNVGVRASTASVAGPAGEAADGIEVLRVDQWSVRRPSAGDNCQSPIYLNLETGHVQRDPPPEVLAELALDEDGHQLNGAEERPEEPTTQRSSSCQAEAEGEQELEDPDIPVPTMDTPSPPCFRRIILGAKNDMPLRMARDIWSALREDTSLFEMIQQRFSDIPSESVLELRSAPNRELLSSAAASGTPLPPLPAELEVFASVLEPGELSEVIGTPSGMQILLRVS